MAVKDVLKAIHLEGFSRYSAVPAFLLKDKRKSPILHDWLMNFAGNYRDNTAIYYFRGREKGLGIWATTPTSLGNP